MFAMVEMLLEGGPSCGKVLGTDEIDLPLTGQIKGKGSYRALEISAAVETAISEREDKMTTFASRPRICEVSSSLWRCDT